VSRLRRTKTKSSSASFAAPRLPRRPLRGRFLLAEAALAETERLLPTYRDSQGDHEGIVFWLGRQLDDLTVLTTALAPNAITSPGSVECSREQMAEAVDVAARRGLGLLAQVHSHPSGWCEHSLGDDEMIFMPYEGMLSVVAPRYGRTGMRPLAGIGVHQHQDGRWVAAEPASVTESLIVIPAGIDLR
jgi:proteasome lid subunit RPN8/RPN11